MNIGFNAELFQRTAGSYLTGKSTALKNPLLHGKTQEYKRRLSGLMRPLSDLEIYRLPRSSGYYVTEKYDGEFALLFFDGTNLISVNPGGTVRTGLPCFDELIRRLKDSGVAECVLAAEIYRASEDGKRTRVHHVVKSLRSPDSESELRQINLAVFDVVELNKAPVESVAGVFRFLGDCLPGGGMVHPARYQIVDSIEEISALFRDWVVEPGGEGLIVRHDQAGWFKIKSRHNFDTAVIGFSEGSDERRGMLHDLLVSVIRHDGTFHELCRVGTGFDDEDRRRLAEELRLRIVPSDYVAVNSDSVAYQMIAPGPVVEISSLDLITENTKGSPINRMVLDWTEGRFSPLARLPLVSIISPLFVRVRDDKDAVFDDAGIRQISDLAEVFDDRRSARQNVSEPSRLLERIVYTKIMKGQRLVRKLCLWKTNKSQTNEFPEYVVYLTDFSPNRQTPLERDLRIAPEEGLARELWAELATKNFVAGWERVS